METIKCSKCDCFINSYQLKNDNCWSCGEDITMLNKDLQSDKIIQNPITELKEEKELESTKGNSNMSKHQEKSLVQEDIKEYPALKFLSGVANFIAWFGVATSVIGGIFYVSSLGRNTSEGVIFLTLVGLVLFTFILFVFWRAISEILILFVDMAQDTRKIRLNQTNKK